MRVLVDVYVDGKRVGLVKFTRVPCVGESIAIKRRVVAVVHVCHDVELEEYDATICCEPRAADDIRAEERSLAAERVQDVARRHWLSRDVERDLVRAAGGK